MLVVPSIRKRRAWYSKVRIPAFIGSFLLLFLIPKVLSRFPVFREQYEPILALIIVAIFLVSNVLLWIKTNYVENGSISFMEDRIWIDIGKNPTVLKLNKTDKIKIEVNSYEGQKYSNNGTPTPKADGTGNYLTVTQGTKSFNYEFLLESRDKIQNLNRWMSKYEQSTSVSLYDNC